MKRALLLFVCVFAFRLTFGLLDASWNAPDERQTYLIGLKSYTTGTWPYFGPDVHDVQSTFERQIPGALEGLMIALPLYVLPIPEAPFIFLNLMTTAAVLLLAWYICKRLPRLSFVWLTIWIAVLPWSLYLSTHIFNPSYLLLPSVLFIVGFMESAPAFRLDVVPLALANALMGLSVCVVMQFHATFVFLVPLAVVSLAAQMYATKRLSSVGYFALGTVLPLACVIPAWWRYGLATLDIGSGFMMPFNRLNLRAFPTIVARYLSTVSIEVPRFIGPDTAGRLAFLRDHPLLAGPAVVLGLVGLIQPFVLVFCWFRKTSDAPGWNPLRWLILVLLTAVEVSFWFTIKWPLAHMFFIFFPVVMIYSCYCWARFASERHWRVFAKAIIVVSVLFQLGYAVVKAPVASLYVDRPLAAKAIQERNYHLLGERRPRSRY